MGESIKSESEDEIEVMEVQHLKSLQSRFQNSVVQQVACKKLCKCYVSNTRK